VGGSNYGAQIVGILHAIENYKQLCPGRYVLQYRILLRRSQRDHALMGLGIRYTI
jgi:hypothetical protein